MSAGLIDTRQSSYQCRRRLGGGEKWRLCNVLLARWWWQHPGQCGPPQSRRHGHCLLRHRPAFHLRRSRRTHQSPRPGAPRPRPEAAATPWPSLSPTEPKSSRSTSPAPAPASSRFRSTTVSRTANCSNYGRSRRHGVDQRTALRGLSGAAARSAAGSAASYRHRWPRFRGKSGLRDLPRAPARRARGYPDRRRRSLLLQPDFGHHRHAQSLPPRALQQLRRRPSFQAMDMTRRDSS